MRSKTHFLVTLIALTACHSCFGQEDSLAALVNKFEDYRSHTLQEKLFVHSVRSFYAAGETLWLKVYCVDATFHKPLDVSSVAYVEIVDKDNLAVLQGKLSLKKGTGKGSFFLPSSLPSGHYLLRAYTRWMQNFSPSLYFQEPLTIVNPFTKLGLKPQDAKPVYDIQFFPEGGHLVTGLKSTVGFRVVDKKGNGIDFQGAVLDERNDTAAHFQPLKFGLGHFVITPAANHQYKAVIVDANGNRVNSSFPSVQQSGFVIHLSDTSKNRLRITVATQMTSDDSELRVYLMAHTREAIAAVKSQVIVQGRTTFLVDKRALGEGISHLTLFN